jgi:hypothetical protein
LPKHPLFTVDEATAVALELPFTVAVPGAPEAVVVVPEAAAASEFDGAKEIVVGAFGNSDNVNKAVPGSVKALPGRLLIGSDPGTPSGRLKGLRTSFPENLKP